MRKQESGTVSILSATAVLIYLAVANMLYGQTLEMKQNNLSVPVLAEPESLTRSTDRNRQVDGEARESTMVKRPDALGLKDPLGQESRGAQFITPADVYEIMCERADDRKPWTEPTPIPGNVNRSKVDKPFQITIK